MDLERPFDFSGKVAAITGGGGVLCGAMARALLDWQGKAPWNGAC